MNDPKFALGAAPPKASEDEKWTATVNRADVIYFGLTKRSTAESEPAWQLVEALQRNGARVALGWTELSAAQQPILDQWQRAEISPQQLLEQLGVPDHGDRLRHALRPDLVQIALGSPRGLVRKIRAGIALTEEERASLPKFYKSRPDAFDNFADRASTSASLRRYNVNDLFHAHLAAEQMIAENIVRFMHDNPKMSKGGLLGVSQPLIRAAPSSSHRFIPGLTGFSQDAPRPAHATQAPAGKSAGSDDRRRRSGSQSKECAAK